MSVIQAHRPTYREVLLRLVGPEAVAEMAARTYPSSDEVQFVCYDLQRCALGVALLFSANPADAAFNQVQLPSAARFQRGQHSVGRFWLEQIIRQNDTGAFRTPGSLDRFLDTPVGPLGPYTLLLVQDDPAAIDTDWHWWLDAAE